MTGPSLGEIETPGMSLIIVTSEFKVFPQDTPIVKGCFTFLYQFELMTPYIKIQRVRSISRQFKLSR